MKIKVEYEFEPEDMVKVLDGFMDCIHLFAKRAPSLAEEMKEMESKLREMQKKEQNKEETNEH